MTPFSPNILRLLLFLCALLPVLLPASGCQSGKERPNVLLVVVDTLRQDRLSCYGYDRQTTPHLDLLARQGLIFENAFTTAPWTLPSHGSLMTGLLPTEHGSHWEHFALSPETPTLAELFSTAGYRTLGQSANPWLSPKNGYDRGFSTYRVGMAPIKQIMTTGDKGAEKTVRQTLAWIDRPAGEEVKPFFVFLNLMEPHEPYVPPQRYAGRFDRQGNTELDERLRDTTLHLKVISGKSDLTDTDHRILSDRYDALVAYTDFQLGRLMAGLRARGLQENTIVVVLADHGENLGDHGMLSHQFCLYDSLLRIPLLLSGPQPLPPGTHRNQTVQITDILPAVLRLCEIPVPGDGKDQAFARMFATGGNVNPAGADRIGMAEYQLPVGALARLKKVAPDFDQGHLRRRLYTLRDGPWKIIASPGVPPELYNLDHDPDELRDLSRARPEVSLRLLEVLGDRFPGMSGDAGGTDVISAGADTPDAM